jgi:xanthine dehydrogenase YagS FAD-binding subunit
MLLELPPFEHVNARSVKETIHWLGEYGEKGRVVAGGTDLFGLMKDRIEGPDFKRPEILINVKTIPEMKAIAFDDQKGLRIGAAVRLQDLITSDIIKEKFPVIGQAARQVGTTQIRCMGTLGGNLCQRPRCVYFRHPHFLCHKRGGNRCYALKGEHRYYHSILKNGKCVMAHPSDMAPALAALDCTVIVANSGGEKEMPILDLFQGPNAFAETILRSDEFITGIKVPNQKGKTYQSFLKHRIRRSADFALASVAAVVRVSGGICEEIRIILGGVAPFPYRALMAEDALRGEKLDEGLFSRAAETSMEGARPLRMNGYKVELTKTLVRRALTSIHHQSLGSLQVMQEKQVDIA